MVLKSYIHAEQEKLKYATGKQKWEYFWEYYKWPVFAAMLVLAVIASFVHSAVARKNVVLSGVFLNCYQSSFEEETPGIMDAFLNEQKLDLKKYVVEVNTSLVFDPYGEEASQDNYQTVQRIGAQITAKELDFVVGNLEAVRDFAYSDTFYDLTTILSKEQLAQYEGKLLYVDAALLDQAGAWTQWPDCKQPDQMRKPVPVMLDVSSCDALMEQYPYLTEPLVLAVAVNAPHEDRVREIVDFLLENT